MKTLHVVLISFTLLLFLGCSTKETQVLVYEQSTRALVKDLTALHVDFENYESRYFMPWDISKIETSKDKASWANYVFRKKNKYYGENTLVLDFEKIKALIATTNFENYNKQISYAITSENTQVRNFPTHKPFFKKFSDAGEGFPFDYMQNTLLHVNTPLLISHYTDDGSWAFVQSPVSTGWIPVKSFVVLDSKARIAFKTAKKLVITKEDSPIYSNKQEYLLHVKLGAMFPYLKEDSEFFYSYMYPKFGKEVFIRIPKTIAQKAPIEFNDENVLHVSSQLLGEKYGWGGYLENRDCSSMTKDFFAAFGLWLPRNSSSQQNSGEYLVLSGLNNEEKEKMILKHGIAFLSLIYLQGHIMLYAGEVDGKAMVMHNVWGLKTEQNGLEGRYILGKSIISDLHVGENLYNIKEDSILIARVEGIVIKPDMPKFGINSFIKAYEDIQSLEDNFLIFKDGTALEYHDQIEKSFEEKLTNPSIKDMLAQSYNAFEEIKAPKFNHDAGRFRNQKLFQKLYGEDKKSIKENLVQLEWIDGAKLYFNKKQSAAIQLQKVINELNKLPKSFKKYITNIGGTFNYRHISGTHRLSAHSYGIAIDLNVKQSKYWKWDREYNFSNNFPKEIIDIFEKYGFIWGGRWYHYDTMHFEYRPELFDSID